MTEKMMKLFANITEARSYLRTNNSMTVAQAKQYVDKHTTMTNGNKVWVVLP